MWRSRIAIRFQALLLGAALAAGSIAQGSAVVSAPLPQALPSAPTSRLQLQSQVRFSPPHTLGAVPGSRTVDGRTVVLGGRTLTLWEVSSGRELRRFDTQGGDVRGVVFSPDGRMIVSLADVRLARDFEVVDKTLTLWDVMSGQALRSWPSTIRAAGEVAFSPDGRHVLMIGESAQGQLIVERWESATGQALPVIAPPRPPRLLASRVTVSADSRWLLIHGLANLVNGNALQAHLLDIASNQYVAQFTAGDACFSADGTRVLSKWMKIAWSIQDRRDAPPDPDAACVSAASVAIGEVSLPLTPDQRGYASHRVTYLNDILRNPIGAPLGDGAANIRTVTFSRDGRWLRLGTHGTEWSTTAAWMLWDLQSGQPAFHPSPKGPPLGGDPFVFSGDLAVAPGTSPQPELQALNVHTWETVRSTLLGAADARMPGVIFSADGGRAFVVRETETEVLDPGSGQPLRKLSGAVAAVSASGDRAIAAGRRSFELRSVDDDTVLATLPTLLGSLALSPDATIVAVANCGPAGSIRTRSRITVQRIDGTKAARTLQAQAYGVGGCDAEFSPDGRWLAARTDESIEVFEVETGRSMIVLDRLSHAGQAVIASASFSADSRFILTVDRDGRGRLIDIATASDAATIVVTEAGGWSIVDRDGRFDTNLIDQPSPLQWIVSDDPLHALPLEQYMRDYYTPGLLARVLRGERLAPVASIASLVRAQPAALVKAIEPRSDEPDLVDVVVEVREGEYRGQRSGARDVRLLRDGYLVASSDGAIPLDSSGSALVRFPGLRVRSDGTTKGFAAYAFNVDRVKGPTTSAAMPSLVPRTAADVSLPRVYVLTIGVNETPAIPRFTLQFAANDARRLADALAVRLKARAGSYSEIVVRTLVSDRAQPTGATKARIRDELSTLARRVRPSDLVVVSFSGHGFAETGTQRFHLFSSDIVEGSRSWPEGTISSDDLADWLRPIDTEQMVLILDACHAAASVEAAGFRPAPLGDRTLGQLAFDKRMRILTATQAADVALEHNRVQQGLLTYAIVQNGLDDGLADWQPKDGAVQLGEWLAYGVSRVPRLYEEIWSGTLRTTAENKPSAAGATKDRGLATRRPRQSQRPALFDFNRRSADDVVITGAVKR